MRVLAAAPLLAVSAAFTVPGSMNNNLMKRGSNLGAIAGCNVVFIACAAACQRIQATHARQACNSHCYATWLRQLREADDDLPPGFDSPVITRRADPQALSSCNNSMVKCINAVNNDAGDPTEGDPVKWDSEVTLCGALYTNCARNAGYDPSSCSEP